MRIGTRRLPMAPVAPATKTFIHASSRSSRSFPYHTDSKSIRPDVFSRSAGDREKTLESYEIRTNNKAGQTRSTAFVLLVLVIQRAGAGARNPSDRRAFAPSGKSANSSTAGCTAANSHGAV